jgi:hypothetical protein
MYVCSYIETTQHEGASADVTGSCSEESTALVQKDSVDAERGVHADAEGKQRDEETAVKKEEEEEAMQRKVEAAAAKKRKEEEEAMVVSVTRKVTFDTPMQMKTEAEAAAAAAAAAAVEKTEGKAAEKAAAENAAAEAKVGILANVRKCLYA